VESLEILFGHGTASGGELLDPFEGGVISEDFLLIAFAAGE
jgi:hypothetical protein